MLNDTNSEEIPLKSERSSATKLKGLSFHLSHSLIREYLVVHNQKEVLSLFDKYNERTEESISKRNQMAKELMLTRKHQSNTNEKDESFLERLILDRLKRVHQKKKKQGSSNSEEINKQKNEIIGQNSEEINENNTKNLKKHKKEHTEINNEKDIIHENFSVSTQEIKVKSHKSRELNEKKVSTRESKRKSSKESTKELIKESTNETTNESTIEDKNIKKYPINESRQILSKPTLTSESKNDILQNNNYNQPLNELTSFDSKYDPILVNKKSSKLRDTPKLINSLNQDSLHDSVKNQKSRKSNIDTVTNEPLKKSSAYDIYDFSSNKNIDNSETIDKYEFDDTSQKNTSYRSYSSTNEKIKTSPQLEKNFRQSFRFNKSSTIGWDNEEAIPKHSKSKPHISKPVLDVNEDDMMFEDVDVDMSFSSNLSTQKTQITNWKHKEIGSTLGDKIRKLIIGDTKYFDKAWLEQGFPFCGVEQAEYGLVQHEGGCCGVMASVQAFIIRELYHIQRIKNSPTKKQLKEALIESLTAILHLINPNKMIVSIGRRSTDISNPDISFAKFIYFEARNRSECLEIIRNNIDSFSESRGLGVLQFIVSAILTRGIDELIKDMDFQTNTLIVEYGYCSQEIVNLLLTGRATTNVFDGLKVIGGHGQATYLKGIQAKSEIGFLSLMESYNYLIVGDNYKYPSKYIWVVFSESHYSVLFSKDEGPSNVDFTLYYWDELANQQEEISFSIQRSGKNQTINLTNDSFVPPLNRCIWTLWPDAIIEWSCEQLY